MRIDEFCPSIGKAEIARVLETLDDNWITEGKKTKQLEGMLAEYCGCRHAIMVPNGTLALFVALKVLGIGPGDEVIVPDFTFFASASSVVLTGAKPVLVDVDEFDGNVLADAAEASLSERTRAIMPVHIYGSSCDMKSLTDLARRHRLLMVEDAAQGMGVTFGDRHVGTFGEFGCISFFADKTMTTGEGGAILTNDDALARRCIYFKNQGRLKRGSFVHDHMGYNFRITDLQAAIGVVQLEHIEERIARKKEIFAAYAEQLEGCPGLRFLQENGFGRCVPFRVSILVDDPEGLAAHLESHDIASRRFFFPMHLQPSLTSDNSIVRHKPVHSKRLFDRGLMLPTGLTLTREQINRVSDAVREFQEAAPSTDSVTAAVST